MDRAGPWLAVLAALLLCCEGADNARGSDDDDEDGGSDGDGDSDGDSDGDADDDGCTPGEIWCYQGWISECNANGDGWIQQTDCSEQGLICAAGECVDISQQCADAINQRSYIGCEYWAVTLANGVNSMNFGFAVAVANGGADDANVRITDNAAHDVTYIVAAGTMLVVDDLPWHTNLKEPGNFSLANWATRQVSNSAYHITSDRPITVYQFSPLNYTIGGDCTLNMDNCSYTNDASLLLPAHVYRDEYIVMSRPTLQVHDTFSLVGSDPGLFAVVGGAGGPSTVRITTTGYTCATDALSNVVHPSYSPGQSFEATLQPGDVLQVLAETEPTCVNPTACSSYNCCNVTADYDLTGSVIEVLSGPNPAVFGGTECSFVPYDKFACDHLEQQLFPLETWGTHYICAHNVTQAPAEPTVWRVMSGSDGNTITFTPASVHPEVTLNKGQYVEFESLADFEIEAPGRVSVAQFMVGQNYTSDLSPTLNGDPAMALAVPVEQFRRDYTFLTPDSYVYNYLTVIHPTGVFPTLNGSAVSGETVDISGGWSRTNMTIGAGIHYIESDEQFGIMVYGVGSYTSYLYPGGLDLKKVDVEIE